MRVSLCGNDWLFKAFLGEDWVWRNAEKPTTRDLRWWYNGTVPGSVHHDLLQLGMLPDPYFELNSLACEWVPERTWIYKKSFVAAADWQGQTVKLHFEGVDYEAQFFLNGEKLGKHVGMYTPVAFDLTDRLKYGEENLLAVVIERAPDEEPQVSKTEYVHTHKSRMTYWWDFCPRMIHIGIWDDVYLEVSGPTQVTDLWVRPQLTQDFTAADLSVSATLDAKARGAATVETVIRLEGQEVARHQSTHALPPGETRINFRVPVANPKLWWPNGHGDQPLYDAEMRVTFEGAESYVKTVTFGIRQVEFAQSATDDSTALPYSPVVNGKQVYINGWNWVPMDVMYGVERPAKLERLLTLAKQANVNMLRVWGGGLIEKEAFYNLCDRYGIMVWQEFIQSSSGIANKPSEDPAFLQMMVREAEQILPRKRNHPSLVIWCGGNELMGAGGKPLTDEEPVLGALADAVRRLDPDRHWLPTSPSGPVAGMNLVTLEETPGSQHDVHGPWEHQGLVKQYTLYNKATSLLHSEFGVEGMAHPRTIAATIAPANRWPASKDNRIYFERGSWWNNHDLVQECFGGGLETVESLSRASQFLQQEGLRYALESNRRRAPQNSGSLPWQFNEPFPNAWCTSAVDYYAQPKAVYYGVAKAYESEVVTARFAAHAWAGFETFEADVFGEGEVEARIVGASGRVYHTTTEKRVSLPLSVIEEELFFLDLRMGDVAANRYLFAKGANLSAMLTAPSTTLRIDGNTITNVGAYAAIQVSLEDPREAGAEGWAYLSTNYFTLLPGESRTVAVTYAGAAFDLEVKAWNCSPASFAPTRS